MSPYIPNFWLKLYKYMWFIHYPQKGALSQSMLYYCKEHHHHRNSYKGRHLARTGLQFGGLVHYHPGGKHAGKRRHSAEGAESSTPESSGSKDSHWTRLELLKPQSSPPVTHFLQQGHTYSKWPHLLIVSLPNDQAFKYMSLWGPFLLKPLAQNC